MDTDNSRVRAVLGGKNLLGEVKGAGGGEEETCNPSNNKEFFKMIYFRMLYLDLVLFKLYKIIGEKMK